MLLGLSARELGLASLRKAFGRLWDFGLFCVCCLGLSAEERVNGGLEILGEVFITVYIKGRGEMVVLTAFNSILLF